MTWVLMDLSYLAHRANYALQRLQHEDYHTGVIYGFFEQMRAICQDPKVNSNKVLIFCDSKKSHRKKAYPDYKRKRREDRDEDELARLSLMWDQIHLLRTRILPEMGVSVYRQTGLESDDLMAWAGDQFAGPKREAVLVTSDGDLYQCISEGTHWYDPGKRIYLDPLSFFTKKGIAAELWGEVKALSGCASDGVSGIFGVGEQRAVQYLLGALPHSYQSYKDIVSPRGRRRVARNRPLVVLPHEKTKPFQIQAPEYKPDVFFHYCERYGIMSYLQEKAMRKWEAFFKGRRTVVRKRGQR